MPMLSDEQVSQPVFTSVLALPGATPLPPWSTRTHNNYGSYARCRAKHLLFVGEQLARQHVRGAEYSFMEVWRDVLLPIVLPFC